MSPPITYQRLMDIRERYHQRNAPGLVGYEAAEQYFAEIFADPQVNALDNQLVFGWGRLTPRAQRLASQHNSPDFGSIHDPKQVRLLLEAQGVVLQGVAVPEPCCELYRRVGGICWG